VFEKKTSMQTNQSIVFCHGIWADGSCFDKVIPALLAERPKSSRAIGLDTNEGDVGKSGLARRRSRLK
jgi:hypothetical protein